MPSGDSRNGVQTLHLPIINPSLAESEHAIIRPNIFARKLGRSTKEKIPHLKTLRCSSADRTVVTLGQLNKVWQVTESPAGNLMAGRCLCENKETLPGSQSRSRPKTRAVPHIPKNPQLPSSMPSHAPHHHHLTPCCITFHHAWCSPGAKQQKDSLAPVSLPIAGSRLPRRSLMSGAALAGPWSQVTGTNHPAGAGQRWLFFRRRHRNHWHRLEKDLLSRGGFYILTNMAFYCN